MSLDPNIMISSLLGSLIGMIGAIAVAILYIRNQNKSENKRRLYERIQEAYFEEGILRIEAAISEYGTSSVFAMTDLRREVGRCLKLERGGLKLLKVKLEEILKRPAITDLTTRNFSLAMKWFPSLHKFGTALYNSVKRSFQLWSRLLSDTLAFENVQRQLSESSVEEFMAGSAAVAKIVQITQMYLEKRLENLQDYVWQRDYEEYFDFLAMTEEQSYETFLWELTQYLGHLTEWFDALPSRKKEDRKRTSLALSKWLSENIDNNPLQ